MVNRFAAVSSPCAQRRSVCQGHVLGGADQTPVPSQRERISTSFVLEYAWPTAVSAAMRSRTLTSRVGAQARAVDPLEKTEDEVTARDERLRVVVLVVGMHGDQRRSLTRSCLAAPWPRRRSRRCAGPREARGVSEGPTASSRRAACGRIGKPLVRAIEEIRGPRLRGGRGGHDRLWVAAICDGTLLLAWLY